MTVLPMSTTKCYCKLLKPAFNYTETMLELPRLAGKYQNPCKY